MTSEQIYFDFTVTQQVRALNQLKKFLTMAASFADHKKFDVNTLFQSRLAPDQFALMKQIQIVCDTAKMSAGRLTGVQVPSHPDNESTLQEAQARIDSVIQFLNSLKKESFSGAADRKVTNARWEQKWMKGSDYFIQYAIPNFHFHLVTSYAILRHNGVDLGKKDYLGELAFQS